MGKRTAVCLVLLVALVVGGTAAASLWWGTCNRGGNEYLSYSATRSWDYLPLPDQIWAAVGRYYDSDGSYVFEGAYSPEAAPYTRYQYTTWPQQPEYHLVSHLTLSYHGIWWPDEHYFETGSHEFIYNRGSAPDSKHDIAVVLNHFQGTGSSPPDGLLVSWIDAENVRKSVLAHKLVDDVKRLVDAVHAGLQRGDNPPVLVVAPDSISIVYLRNREVVGTAAFR